MQRFSVLVAKVINFVKRDWIKRLHTVEKESESIDPPFAEKCGCGPRIEVSSVGSVFWLLSRSQVPLTHSALVAYIHILSSICDTSKITTILLLILA